MSKIVELSEAAISKYRSSIVPVYGSSLNGTPEHIGTAVLLNINGHKSLMTAAHVIDHNQCTCLYLGASNDLILIEMDFLTSQNPNRERCHDHYDFAVGSLSKNAINALEGAYFISESDISFKNIEPDGTTYTIAGYPNSKNKKINRSRNTVSPKLFHYSAVRKPNQSIAEKLKISEKSHIFTSYDSKYSQDSKGQKINSIKLEGLSGGPVFNIGQLSNPKVLAGLLNPNPCLAGIFIEYYRGQKAVIATRIGTIIEAIKYRL